MMIPRSAYDQRKLEEAHMFQITLLEARLEAMAEQLARAEEEIRRLRMAELRCMCAQRFDFIDEFTINNHE